MGQQTGNKKSSRKQLSVEQVRVAARNTELKLFLRLDQKGYGTFASRHEILGILSEEHLRELIKAVHEEPLEGVRRELLDIAVTAIFGIACIDNGTLDW